MIHIDKYKIFSYSKPYKNGKQSGMQKLVKTVTSEDPADIFKLLSASGNPGNGTAGTTNTGGGGGAGNPSSGAGGSGIVIIRYKFQ